MFAGSISVEQAALIALFQNLKCVFELSYAEIKALENVI